VDTTSAPTAMSIPVDVPPGFWRRESTHCPQPISPFLRGARAILTECWRGAFSELGVLADTLELREIGGWVYTTIVPLDEERIPERAERAVETMRSGRFASIIDQWPQWRSESAAGVARFRNMDLADLTDEGLAGHLGEVMQFSGPVFQVHFLLHCAGAIVLADLALACRQLLGWDDARSLDLLSGLSTASTDPAAALAKLTAMARDRTAVRRFLESGEEDASRLSGLDPEFASAFAAYQEEYGFRAIRYDILDPSLKETPSLTLRLIAEQLRTGYDPVARAAATARRREALRAEARTLLAGRGEADRARFQQALERAERWYPVREDEAPMTFSEPLALIRRIALEIGRRLVESSLIDQPGDIFFLELEEAVAALIGRTTGTAPDGRDLVRRRQAERAWVEAHPGPPSYGTEPPPPSGAGDLPPGATFPTDALRWLVERSGHFTSSHPQPRGSRLTGVPASGGTCTGQVRVLRSETDFGKLRAGDVLVCPITSPAWSVLFPNVSAVVTDAGGVLSHSAIIAREFDIPAVVATGNATDILRDGQRVTVNGTTGCVEVLA
jgi:phosphohistidine swiveling domain-containing protein